MRRTITQFLGGLMIALGLMLPFAAPALAAPVDVFGPACDSAPSAKVCPQEGDKELFPAIKDIINMMLLITGIVAVIMIVVGGLSYVLSGGDQNRVTIAKNTVIYSVIGLIIAAMSYAIVNFVIARL